MHFFPSPYMAQDKFVASLLCHAILAACCFYEASVARWHMPPKMKNRLIGMGSDSGEIDRFEKFCYRTRSYSSGGVAMYQSVRCGHCYKYCWPRYEYHRRATNTIEYYCESCSTWYWRHVYDFRMDTLAKTLPDWMLGNAGNRYNLLLGGDSDPTSLLVRRRHVHLYLLLTANGDLSWLLVPVSPHGSTTWQYHKSLIHRIIAMLVHGRPAAAVRRNEFDIEEFIRRRVLDGSILCV